MHICQKMILKELDVSVFNEIVWKSLTSFDHSRSPWDRQRFDTINFASKTKLLSSQLKIAKLQAVQNFACRIVSGAQKYDHVTPILRQLNWLPVKQHIYYRDSIMAFKCMNCLAPEYLSDQFTKRSSISTYKTRNSQLLDILLFN